MQGTLTFTSPDDVVPDHERPGLLRAREDESDQGGDARRCELTDLSDPTSVEPGLEAAGFETIDLSGNDALQRTLAHVREADQLCDGDAQAIRESLTGMSVELASGTVLRIDMVVDDGLFHRRSGPNGLDVNPSGIDGTNGHGGARKVHGDQDVYGTPLRQLMHGAAPDLFRHVTPDGRNDHAGTFLLNLWIPLHAPVQPLALMDRRTLDASQHQLRYGLPVDGFLERDDDATVNDIWSFLYDEGQEWYIHTEMGPDRGYVFDTLGTAHGAAVLPGEDGLEALYIALQQACAAKEPRDRHPVRPATQLAVDAPVAIREAHAEMTAVLDDDHTEDGWADRGRAAMDSVIRRSVELRLVASASDG